MDLTALSPTMLWAMLIGGAYLYTAKGSAKLLGTKSTEKNVGAGLAIFAALMIFAPGVVEGLLDGNSSQTVADSDWAELDIVRFDSGIANSSTSVDFINKAENELTFELADTTTTDGNTMTAQIELSRIGTSIPQQVKVTCDVPSFEGSDDETYRIATSTSGKRNVFVDGSGTRTSTGVTKVLDFAEGESSLSLNVSYYISEAAHDALLDGDTAQIDCDFNGNALTIFTEGD